MFVKNLTVIVAVLLASLLNLSVAKDSQHPDEKAKATNDAEVSTKRNAEPDESDWPLFRGDTKSTGVSSSRLPDALEVLWSFKVPNGSFESSAAIVEERAYVADLDGKLFCFDMTSGEKLWEFSTELGFVAPVCVQDGLVYAGDIDGKFFCIDGNGKEKWSHQTNAEISSAANFYKGNVLIGSQDATLYCLNAKSGELIWSHELADQIRCTPTIVGDRTFVAGCDGHFHIIDLKEGKEVGSVPIESPTGSTPAVLGDRVFFGTEEAGFYAIDWKKIEIAWHFEGNPPTNSIRSSAAVLQREKDALVIMGTRSRRVYALNSKDGEVVWSFTARSNIDSSPVIVGDRVIVAGTDGRIYLLNVDDGKKIWEKQFDGGFVGSPAISRGRVVIATNRGVVYCLGKKK